MSRPPLSVVVLLCTACAPGGRVLPDVDAQTVVVISGPAFHVLQLRDVLDVRRGLIERQPLAVVLQVAERHLLDLLQGVKLSDVARVCDPCGLGP